MSDRHLPTPLMGGSDTEQLAEYRTISRTAIAAATMGMLSVLAWLHPVSWAIPVVGVLLSAYALQVTCAANSVVSGRRLALLGMALSLFLGLSAVANWWMARQLVCRQGREFADRFVEYLEQRDWPAALECTEAFMYRQSNSMPLAEHYEKDEQASKLLQAFRDRSLYEVLSTSPENTPIEFDHWAGYAARGHQRDCELVYRFVDALGESQRIAITVGRNSDPEGDTKPHWRIWKSDLIEP